MARLAYEGEVQNAAGPAVSTIAVGQFVSIDPSEETKAANPIARWDSKTGLNDLLSDLEGTTNGNSSGRNSVNNNSNLPSRSSSSNNVVLTSPPVSHSTTPPPPSSLSNSHSPPRPQVTATATGSTNSNTVKEVGIASTSKPSPALIIPSTGLSNGGLAIPSSSLVVPVAASVNAAKPSTVKRVTLGAKKVSAVVPPSNTSAEPTPTVNSIASSGVNAPHPPVVSAGEVEDVFDNFNKQVCISESSSDIANHANTRRVQSDDEFLSFEELDKQKQVQLAAAMAVKRAPPIGTGVSNTGVTPPSAPTLSGIHAAYLDSEKSTSPKPNNASAALATESIYKSAIPTTIHTGSRMTGSGVSNQTVSISGTSTLARDRFGKQKGIGSDAFDETNNSRVEAVKNQLSTVYKNSTSISSDMFSDSNNTTRDEYTYDAHSNNAYGNTTTSGYSSRTTNWK